MEEKPIAITDGDFIQGHNKDLILRHRPDDLFRVFIEHRQRELLPDGFLPEIALGRWDVVESHLGGIVEGQRKVRRCRSARCHHRISRVQRGVPHTVTLVVQHLAGVGGFERTGDGVGRDGRRILAEEDIYGIDGALFGPGQWTDRSVWVLGGRPWRWEIMELLAQCRNLSFAKY